MPGRFFKNLVGGVILAAISGIFSGISETVLKILTASARAFGDAYGRTQAHVYRKRLEEVERLYKKDQKSWLAATQRPAPAPAPDPAPGLRRSRGDSLDSLGSVGSVHSVDSLDSLDLRVDSDDLNRAMTGLARTQSELQKAGAELEKERAMQGQLQHQVQCLEFCVAREMTDRKAAQAEVTDLKNKLADLLPQISSLRVQNTELARQVAEQKIEMARKLSAGSTPGSTPPGTPPERKSSGDFSVGKAAVGRCLAFSLTPPSSPPGSSARSLHAGAGAGGSFPPLSPPSSAGSGGDVWLGGRRRSFGDHPRTDLLGAASGVVGVAFFPPRHPPSATAASPGFAVPGSPAHVRDIDQARNLLG